MLDDLARSDLDAADAKRMQLRPYTSQEAAALNLSRKEDDASGYLIPYFDHKGRKLSHVWRYRYFKTTHDNGFTAGAELRKYDQPADSPPETYLRPGDDWEAVRKDTSTPLILTEGEKKAVCATKNGFLCLGLGGVFSFASKKREQALLPSLQAFTWQGRDVFICFDSDAVSNKDVLLAESRLTDALRPYSPNIRIVRIPPDKRHPDTKVGLDDFLAKHGADAFEKLLNDAVEVSPWGEPAPLGISLPPVLPFTEDMLPDAIRPFCADIAERMQVPLAYTAVTAMFTLGASVGRRVLIQPKAEDSTYTEVPNLWGFIVGRPSTLKSPVIRDATEPLRKIEKSLADDYRNDIAKCFTAKEHNKLKVSVWESQSKKAMKADANAKPAPYPTLELEEPIRKRLITTDATPEALLDLCAENPTGIAVLTDELMTLLCSFERQGREQARAAFISGWSGHQGHTYDTVGRGHIHAEHVVLSSFGSIQPSRMQAYLAGTLSDDRLNDGLIQRYQLAVWPDASVPKYVDKKPDLRAIQHMNDLCLELSRLPDDKPHVLRFDAAAQNYYVEWYSALTQRLSGETLTPIMEEHLNKYRKLVPVLALLFALADRATSSGTVPLKHLKLAVRWAEVLETHAARIYSVKLSAPRIAAGTLAKKLLSGWKRDDTAFTLREVYFKGWAGLSESNEARAAASVLVDFEWLRFERSTTEIGGRPAESYRINPAIYAMKPSEEGFEGFEGTLPHTNTNISQKNNRNAPRRVPSKPSKPPLLPPHKVRKYTRKVGQS
jgi:putative DNA primase/helicase